MSVDNSFYAQGFNRLLYKAGVNLSGTDSFNPTTGVGGLPSSDNSGGSSLDPSSSLPSSIDNSIPPSSLQSGSLDQILYSKKKSFTDTTNGWIQGIGADGTYKWLIGGSSTSIDWNVTTANTLTIVGAISATTGTIGGFNIGADYIRDAANSMGLASTVTAGDDVRFWAGAAFASRASAPLRITESGLITATGVNLTGTLATNLGAVLDITNLWGDGSDGALSISAGTTTLNTASKHVYQYTSVSITGTADLAFGSNVQNIPVFILVQGNLTITSSATAAVHIDGFGALGGAGAGGPPNSGVAGSVGTTFAISTNAGQGGTGGVNNFGGGGGGGGAGWGNDGTVGVTTGSSKAGGAGGISLTYLTSRSLALYMSVGHCGSGGGGGGGGFSGDGFFNGGAGANGGGVIFFIVKGNINLTGTLTAKGNVGSNGSSPGGAGYAGGGGGGGGGGFIGVLYGGSVTANTATYTVTGGAGGNGGTDTHNGGGAGGAGGNNQSFNKLKAHLRFNVIINL